MSSFDKEDKNDLVADVHDVIQKQPYDSFDEKSVMQRVEANMALKLKSKDAFLSCCFTMEKKIRN